MATEDRFDFIQAGKSATKGCVILVMGLILSCVSGSWITWQSIKLGYIYFSFWSCIPLAIFIITAVLGAFKFLIGSSEQDEIEARESYELW